MEYSPTLSVVDLFPGKHGLDHFSQASLSRQFYKKINGPFANPVLGVVEENIPKME